MDDYEIANAHGYLEKAGATAEPVYGLVGRLYASKSGWVLLSVPNAVGRGLFDALGEAGVELPTKDGIYNAHVSVMRPEELEALGGVDAITERGHEFRYQLGAIKTVVPGSWAGVSRVWFVEIKSPELQTLRKSYGLSPLPQKNGEPMPFHMTFAVRKVNVIRENEVAKTSEERPFHGKTIYACGHEENCRCVGPHDPPRNVEEACWNCREDKEAQDATLAELHKVKRYSDAKQYQHKHHALRGLISRQPDAWEIGKDRGMASVRNKRTGFRYHMPNRELP